MKRFVSRCIVMRNGQRVQNMKTFKINERKYAEQFKFMDGVGVVDTIPDQTFSLDNVISADNPKLSYTDVRDESWTVILKGGKRITFSGVDALSDGELSFDGEKESVQTIVFGYNTFVIE